jgi:hypothetical protein
MKRHILFCKLRLASFSSGFVSFLEASDDLRAEYISLREGERDLRSKNSWSPQSHDVEPEKIKAMKRRIEILGNMGMEMKIHSDPPSSWKPPKRK